MTIGTGLIRWHSLLVLTVETLRDAHHYEDITTGPYEGQYWTQIKRYSLF